MADDEDGLFGPGEQVAEGLRVALDDREPALAVRLGHGRGGGAGGPRAVLLDVGALVAPDQRVVQPRIHEPGDVTPFERDVGCFPGALELARHAEIELFSLECFAESRRFTDALLRQGHWNRDVPVQPAVRRVLALAVAR